jgi:hypothetical protein
MKAKDTDAEFHVLRSFARAIDDGRTRQDVESARFNLYAAMEGNDLDAARR